MSYYLIGIGGTGARCLESFIHLNGAGLLKDKQPVKMFFVDADVSCGNLTRTQKAADLYSKATALNYGGTGIMENDLKISKAWTPVPENRKDMDSVFNINLLEKDRTGTKKPLAMLYKALFTEQERTTPLDKGFRGHPAIGAAVMSNSIAGEEDKVWKELRDELALDKDARIFLFASVFGGTGAAGFPTIARMIKTLLPKNRDNEIPVHIGGALILPYFRFPAAPTEEAGEMQAKADEFMLNTRSALDYYNKSELLRSVFKSIYMVGDNDLHKVNTFSLGSNTQKNDANFIELYAALAAFDFFNKEKLPEERETPMIGRGDDDNPDTLNVVSWNDLPDPCTSGNLKEKLSTYIKFLYTYNYCVLPKLEECALDKSYKTQVAWYMNLVQKHGKIDVHDDTVTMDKFRDLGKYSETFFTWLGQISTHSTRKIQLVHEPATQIPQGNFRVDVHKLVCDDTAHPQSLTYNDFWKQLCSYHSNLKGVDTSGTGFLMNAIYNICNK